MLTNEMKAQNLSSATITYDREAEAMYIRYSDREVDHTVEFTESVYVDADADGNPIGFEILEVGPGLADLLPQMPESTLLSDLLRAAA
jgi:uncharacterized protein YuzE